MSQQQPRIGHVSIVLRLLPTDGIGKRTSQLLRHGFERAMHGGRCFWLFHPRLKMLLSSLPLGPLAPSKSPPKKKRTFHRRGDLCSLFPLVWKVRKCLNPPPPLAVPSCLPFRPWPGTPVGSPASAPASSSEAPRLWPSRSTARRGAGTRRPGTRRRRSTARRRTWTKTRLWSLETRGCLWSAFFLRAAQNGQETSPIMGKTRRRTCHSQNVT